MKTYIIKEKARKIIKKNYSVFLKLYIILILASIISVLFPYFLRLINSLYIPYDLEYINYFINNIIKTLLLVIPYMLLIKAALNVYDNKENSTKLKSLISDGFIKKSAAVSLIVFITNGLPNAIKECYNLYKMPIYKMEDSNTFAYNVGKDFQDAKILNSIMAIILAIIAIFLVEFIYEISIDTNNKIFKNVKTNLQFMFKNGFSFIKLLFSFIGWWIIPYITFSLLSKPIADMGVDIELQSVLLYPLGFGLGFYVVPYYAISHAIFWREKGLSK